MDVNRAIRNIGRRPLSLNFNKATERVLPLTISAYHSDAEWKDGFALKQAEKYVKDREAVWVYGPKENNDAKAKTDDVGEASIDEIIK